MATNITGKIIKCEVRRDRGEFCRYSPNSERYEYRANIGIQAEDGRRFYFDSPCLRMCVANAVGVSVVTYDADGESANWWTLIDGSGVATAERSNTNGHDFKFAVGDTLTIRATVKAEKPTYTTVNRVKLLSATVTERVKPEPKLAAKVKTYSEHRAAIGGAFDLAELNAALNEAGEAFVRGEIDVDDLTALAKKYQRSLSHVMRHEPATV